MLQLKTTSDTPSYDLLTVTPYLAGKWLTESNNHNRHVRQVRVDSYARDMANGDWKFNGDAIRFADDGTLLDGQHRLLAIVASGVPITTLVVWNLPRESQETMDSGQARTAGNALTLRGEFDPNNLAAVARCAIRYSRGHRANGGAGSVTNSEVIAYIEQHPDIRRAVEVVGQSRRSGLPASPSIIGAAYHICAQIDVEDAEEFFVTQLIDGVGLRKNSPARVLRCRLVQENEKHRRRMNIDDVFRYTCKAWNAYRDGQELTRLQAPRGGWTADNFPVPH